MEVPDPGAAEARVQALEAACAEQARKAAEWERAFKAAVLDRELATALTGRPLVPGAAAQLVKLWHDDFDVHDENGTPRVVARDGRPLGQVVSERLASPDFAHFCQPTSRGGTASPGPGRVAASGPDAAPPRNLGEITIRRWLETTARPGDSSVPVGLSRRRR